MTVNHKEVAEEYVSYLFRAGATDSERLAATAKAQVHATLYLGDQQRIANLIAYRDIVGGTARGTDGMNGSEREYLDHAVREGLGIQ